MWIDEQRAFADGQFCFRIVSRVDLVGTMPLESLPEADEATALLAPAIGFYLSFVVKATGFARAAALVEEWLRKATVPLEEGDPDGYCSTLEVEAVTLAELSEDVRTAIAAHPGEEAILFASKRCYFSQDQD